jgi:apolipoprotein N-acyltransferase
VSDDAPSLAPHPARGSAREHHFPLSLFIAAMALGAVTVFGFAPFAFFGVPVVTLALLFAIWQNAPSARNAAWIGFGFGLGLLEVGASWLYIALHNFGGMPLPLAAIGTAGFCAYLALYPALAGWLAVRWTPPGSLARVVAAAAAWTFTEWMRSLDIAGFPWLIVGYSQLTQSASSPLAGYAPLGGVWLVTLAIALCAAALVMAIDAFATPARTRGLAFILGGVALAGVGTLLARIEWTAPVGEPVAVSLVQGNVTQELKFDPTFRDNTFNIYEELVNASRGRLIVLPESAYPMFAEEIPETVVQHLLQTAKARDGDVLAGMFTIDPPLPGQEEPRYYNTVVSIGSHPPQFYRKRHLVPFGEIIPLEPVIGWFIRAILAIPLASQTPGAAAQPPFAIVGQKVAVDICYEDAFGSDIRSQAETATLLINVTNDAWYGHSLAAEQHNQMAAMRALETGRPLLRATNTGITSVIGHDGRELSRLPWFTRGILELEITGRQGATPYLRWGDAPGVLVAIALFAATIVVVRLGRSR